MKVWWKWLKQKGPVPGEIDDQYNWSEGLLIVLALMFFPGSVLAIAYAYLLGWIK